MNTPEMTDPDYDEATADFEEEMSWWEEEATDREVQEALEKSRNSPPPPPFPLDVSTLPADERETVLKVIALCKADPKRAHYLDNWINYEQYL